MTNRQASKLRSGQRVRRKQPWGVAEEDPALYIVERVVLPEDANSRSVTVHAGGVPFKAWEIERFWKLGER